MKLLVKHIVGLLLLVLMTGCYSVDITYPDSGSRVQVGFTTAVPVPDTPATRAITDDSVIQNYVIWVFSNNKFVDAVYSDDTYQEDGETYPVVRLKDNGEMFLMLPDDLKNVSLAMVANVPDIKNQEPKVGDSMDTANAKFNSSVGAMPMYGTNNTVFDVAPGADAGLIILRRAMARVEIDAIKAIDHFVLEHIYMYYPNENGKVQEAPIVNEPSTGTLSGTVIGAENRGYIYLPEVNLAEQTDFKSCLILEGKYKNVKTYYKLDFICQDNSSGDIRYYPLEEISRNYRYIFDIQYLTAGTGYKSPVDAINNPASNAIPEGNIQLIKVYDTEIKDITTNNYIYLGVTSSQLQTAEGISYHVANVSIVTNSEKGWKFEELPGGVYLSVDNYIPVNGVEVVSVWVYLDKSQYTSGSSVTIYVYGENIRKSLTIKVP